MKTTIRFFLVSFFILCSTMSYSQPSAIEKRIQQNVISQQQSMLSLLEKIVNVNSNTANIEGIHQVGEIVRVEFEKLGFKTRWVEEPSEMQRAGMLIAERQGSKGKRLLLIGHLDTVFSKSGSFQKFTLHDKVVQGPGVIDDKSGIIVILSALEALNKEHALDNTSITVALTGDEEDAGKPTSISRSPLVEFATYSDIALDFEPATDIHSIATARRGIALWKIEAQGKEAHSSVVFQKNPGFGAIYETARILDTMRHELAGEKYLTFNPGIIVGGTKIDYDKNKAEGDAFGKQNVIAQSALISGDLRFLTNEQKKNAEKKMTAIVNQHLSGTNASIYFQDVIPAMSPTKGNEQLLKQYSAISEELGYGPIQTVDPSLYGAVDISHIAHLEAGALSGLGAVGKEPHSVNETLDLTSLPIVTQRAALLIYRLTG